MTEDLLAHRVEGDGEPLLLLNGGMMTYASWETIAETLGRNYRIIRCDLRGQLLSPGPVPVELADNLDELERLIDHLAFDSVHVLGTSYGGEIGLLMAALLPERVNSLIAVTVSDYASVAIRQGCEDLRRLVRESRLGADKGRIHDRIVGEVYSEGYRRRHAEELAARREGMSVLPETWFEGVEGILTAVERLDLRPHLAAIRCPTLVVVAANDQSIPPQRSLALAAEISDCEIMIHETSGHALVAEDPAWLADVSLDFLARHSLSTV